MPPPGLLPKGRRPSACAFAEFPLQATSLRGKFGFGSARVPSTEMRQLFINEPLIRRVLGHGQLLQPKKVIRVIGKISAKTKMGARHKPQKLTRKVQWGARTGRTQSARHLGRQSR